ncbi:hypothetical protein D9615_003836 [Tricholomella constricta]|uniref:Protoporphyrinogen oxidase n=1 Tax=Tricholomella constricta TaxID=117010 RepID=A0A8H5HIF7_9AGAR|nr:hypothetical protein D9615_003836 [Tricholomella constricta]
MPPPRHIAVLGGGLTGLSSAFHLSRRFPNAHITLLERQNRLGGWVSSEQVQLGNDDGPKDAKVSLTVESGPRTLRPVSKAILELINLLNLQPALLTTPSTAPAARSRFLYTPALRSGLTALPSSPLAFLRSPLRKIFLPAILREPLRKSNRSQDALEESNRGHPYDESLDSFLSRRFGSEVARVLGSALCHGVYAADARELSVRAAFPALYDLEEQGRGSVVFGVLKAMLGFGGSKQKMEKEEYDLGDVEALMRGVAVYSFRGGIQTLSDALVSALDARTNLEICSGEGVSRIEMREDEVDSLLVHTSKRTLNPTHIVSALPLPLLSTLLPPPSSHAPPLPHLTANPASSVIVLSLIFAAPPSTIHPPGFGYLVPRPLEGYPTATTLSSAADLGVLGTVFDSCALPIPPGSEPEAGYTKLTVMLGGPYSISLRSDDELLLTRVLAHLKEALQRELPRPVAWRVWRHERCIPTPRVGHVGRMAELGAVLAEGEGRGAWKGRMEVVGAGVGGVSVGDCVEAGRRVGARW